MDGIFDPNGYLQKKVEESISELRKSIKSITIRKSKEIPKEILNYFREYRRLIVIDLIEFYDQQADIKELLREMINDNEIYQKQQNIQDLVTLHVLLRIERMTIKSEISIDSYQDYERIKEFNKRAWYRGQADFKWKLIPSYYRSIPYTSHPIHIDNNYVDKDYIGLGISKKIESIFGKYILDYEKLAFIQHSLAITPLLDFSKDINSAVGFAVSNYTTPRLLKSEPAALYILDVDYEEMYSSLKETDTILSDLNIEYYSTAPTVATLVKSNFWISFLNNTLHSEVKLIDVKTNDRMRIQDGTFVLFNNVMFVCDDMIVSSSKYKDISRKLRKIMITSKGRNEIYKMLPTIDTKYQIQNMMDPYGYMIE